MFFAILAIVWAACTGHATTYGTPGTPGAPNGGVVVHTGQGTCVGYEWHGEPGLFGTAYGLTGGDCN
jgi:hypothetical protein